ncbi:MAG: hypothetical protein AUJ49_07615 [Desulfovibrionaceae bacterium CG1_02_65_16]|nr:MAG: hypothetical protein AUJ49_07615 [Desulfovibrionaceae bacterium CG1_02_65_16]
MLKLKRLLTTLFVCLLLLAVTTTALAQRGRKQSAQPKNKVYRVAVLEAGTNWVHDKMLKALQAALAEKGWGDRVQFPADAHSVNTWTTMGKAGTHRMAAQLMQRTDIDLVIGLGTEAAQALLACNNGRTPIVAMTLSDPIGSGVVKSAMDSGVDNLTTCVMPDQWLNMLRLFHTVVHFKKLGVLYEDTAAGRTYTSLEDARDVVREKGARLIEFSHLKRGATVSECKSALTWLVTNGVDAVYLPDIPCFDWTTDDPRPLLSYLREHKVATFARTGLSLVQLGALMGAYDFELKPLGRFHAGQMISIFQGTQPRKLKMVMPDAIGLSLNLKTARMMGRDLSPDVLVNADVIVSRDLGLGMVRKGH